ncbi:phosphoribosylaminoimidazolesuccinocarboxamide synthase [soil metagenome]
MNPDQSKYQRGELVYEGKAKRLYSVPGRPDLIWQEFKDSLTAFNAQKLGSFPEKGALNREICALLFEELEMKGILTHRVEEIPPTVVVTKKLEMIKLELVVRNVLAGSTAKKFGIEEGTPLEKPLVEFYYKDDALADPFVSDEQAMFLKTAKSRAELDELREFGLKVNAVLKDTMDRAGLQLIDFKIEVGRDSNGLLYLADEISPDCCRLWDKVTGEKMDKDRFRRDLGGVAEAYRAVCERLGKALGKSIGKGQ